ncbi:ABC transporter substrate-binding protein [Bosea sp. (in: a-proteobacteria)]|uniref:ABC transporter substrate-binding protein n=1 Tax=Bosea sp. (in: a-proteobacteria) TaxID=1871050 RepID=UPI003FA59311
MRALSALLFGALAAFSLMQNSAQAQAPFDLGPEQPGRVRAEKQPEAVAALPKGFKFVEPGVFTVAVSPGGPPLATYATDARTVVGADADFAQLVADSLGLKLNLLPIAWADWPLGLASGKYDAVISNVGVTEQRKEKFDFSTYRQGLHGFFVRADSKVAAIREPKDAAGLSISVGGGTNQERILVEWSKQNLAAGLKPIELQLFDDEAGRLVALRSGRVDAIVQPHAQLVFIAARDRDIRRVGTLSAGWPLKSDVAITTRKGSGLVDALTIATNGLIANGRFRQSLARWQLEEEALEKSETNPPGLPKY